MIILLGQSGAYQTADVWKSVLPAVVILIATVLAAGAILMFVRARVLARGRLEEQEGGLMDSIRKMKERGEISQQEFDQMREAMKRRLKSDHAGSDKQKS